MRILAIDPGPTQSAWLALNTASRVETDYGPAFAVGRFGISPNEELLTSLLQAAAMPEAHRFTSGGPACIVIEQITPMGMAVGAEVFETAFWSGRFAQAAQPVPFDRIPRRLVKTTICGNQQATDSNIRASLIDRYSDGRGKALAVGLKATPGPLFGVATDVWSALAIAVTYAERLRRAA